MHFYLLAMSLGEKLKELRLSKKWSLEYVGGHIGKTKQMVRNYETGVSQPPLDILYNLASLFEVNRNVLIGEGEISPERELAPIKTDVESKKNRKSESFEIIGKVGSVGVPFYDIDVFAGDIETFNNNQANPDSYLILPGAKGCDFGCRVLGNSMTPEIQPGDIIACKEIHDNSFMVYGAIYLIITAERRLVKKIRRHPTNENLYILKSENSKEYDDIDLPKDRILRLYAVKLVVNQKEM